MPQQTLIDELEAGYADKLADLTLGRKLEEHYLDVSQCVRQINALIETNRLIEEELQAFMIIGYQYYMLKDRLLSALIEKQELN